MYLQLSKSSHKQEKKVERRISPNQINEMREKERTDGQQVEIKGQSSQ